MANTSYNISVNPANNENEQKITGSIVINTLGPKSQATGELSGFPDSGTIGPMVGEYTITTSDSELLLINEMLIILSNEIINLYNVDLGGRLTITPEIDQIIIEPIIEPIPSETVEEIPTEQDPPIIINESGSTSTVDSPDLVQNPDLMQQENPIEIDDKQDNKEKSSPELNIIFETSLSPTQIIFDTGDIPKDQKEQFKVGLGKVPLIYYNGIHIEYSDIKSFTLYHENILPACKITVIDATGLFRSVGFPTDDTKVTVYIYSRSQLIRPIYLDFKITTFKDMGGEFLIMGVIDIPNLFLKRTESFSNKSSMEALKEIAKLCNIGFATNINDTQDQMTWINIGQSRYNFINEIVSNSYIGENSFANCYIDFYYNLCYIDLEKELSRDIKDDMMYSSTGKSDIIADESVEENLVPLFLTTDKMSRDTNGYISKYTVINKSTKSSLNNSYLQKTKYYNERDKELLIFDIDSLTNDDRVILKGKINDNTFFSENYNKTWTGKMDVYDNGKGNVHQNYNYSKIHNSLNKRELDKIFLRLFLPVPNYNLYINQKVQIELIFDKPSATSLKHSMVSGEVLISGIEFIFDGKKLYQNVDVIRRDLEKLD